MEYKTYWSIADLPTNSITSDEIFLYIGMACLLLWWAIKKFKKKDSNHEKTILLWSVGFFGLISTVAFIYIKFYTVDPTTQRIESLLNSSSIAIVEGSISDFERLRPLSKNYIVTQESFRVDSVRFAYSDEALGRFNRFSDTNNNLFRNGLPVRITYGKIQHEILKVEVAKNFCCP